MEVWLRSFGLKIMVLSRATYLVSVGNNINSRWLPVASPTISRALLPMTSKADKLSMDAEPVAHDKNTIFTSKLGDQTFVPPYSTDNHSKTELNIATAGVANATLEIFFTGT